MPKRVFVAKELSVLFGAIANPNRIRIIEELGVSELDVNSLQSVLGLSHSAVSQQLSVLRSHRLVKEERRGRHVYYRLSDPRLAGWLLGGLDFLQGAASEADRVREAVDEVRQTWRQTVAAGDPGNPEQ